MALVLVVSIPVGYAVADRSGVFDETEAQPASTCPAATKELAEAGIHVDDFAGGCPSQEQVAEDVSRRHQLEAQADKLLRDLRQEREEGKLDAEGQKVLRELEEKGGPDWLTHAGETQDAGNSGE